MPLPSSADEPAASQSGPGGGCAEAAPGGLMVSGTCFGGADSAAEGGEGDGGRPGSPAGPREKTPKRRAKKKGAGAPLPPPPHGAAPPPPTPPELGAGRAPADEIQPVAEGAPAAEAHAAVSASAATAAADPPLEPPGTHAKSQGLNVGP